MLNKFTLLCVLLFLGCSSNQDIIKSEKIPLEITTYQWETNSPTYLLFEAPEDCDYETPPGAFRDTLTDARVAWNVLTNEFGFVPSQDLYPDVEIREHGTIDNDWLGSSQIWVNRSNQIVRAQILLNTIALTHDYGHLEEAPRHVLCSELGWITGSVNSRGSIDSCMDDCSLESDEDWEACLNDVVRTTPNVADQQAMWSIYSVDNDAGVVGADAGVESSCDDASCAFPEDIEKLITLHVFPAR